MVAAAVSTSFGLFTAPSPSPSPSQTPLLHLGSHGIKSKPSVSCTGVLVAKMQAQARASPMRINEHAAVDLSSLETQKKSNHNTFISQFLGSGALLGAMSVIHKAAEKQWKLFDKKLADPFSVGEIVDGAGSVFRQNYYIRSYDLGPNRTATIQTLTNLIQETSLNNIRMRGLLSDGFGSTPEMVKRNLIMVFTKLHVEVNRYPSWGDVVEVDNWFGTEGKNSIHTNCIIRDSQTGEILARSTSMIVMMNKETRRLSKIPAEIKSEIGRFVVNCAPLLDEESMKMSKPDDKNMDYVRTGLCPIWNDLDVNQHVSNIKYSGWMVESVPNSIKKSHELASITLEFKRECMMDCVLQSLTSVVDGATDNSSAVVDGVRCVHLLRLESGTVVAKGYTKWRPNTPVLGEV